MYVKWAHHLVMYFNFVFLCYLSYLLTNQYGMPLLFDFNAYRIGETYIPLRYLYDWS